MSDYTEHLISMAGGDGEPDALELDAIQARADAATEGPWRAKECAPCTERGRLDVSIWAHDGNIQVADWCDDDEFTKADANFIAAARTDVPALLALVREQAAKLERVEAMHVREVIAVHEGSGEEAICVVCAKYWPCKTIAALTATEGAA